MQGSMSNESLQTKIVVDGSTTLSAEAVLGFDSGLRSSLRAYMQSTTFWLVVGLTVLFAFRVALMMFLPLADTTEARYGEIARQMVSNGLWLMDHMDPATPFFAKPPLSTWVSAVSMTLFGISEFTARLPALLVSIASLAIGVQFAQALGVRNKLLPIAVAAVCPLFFISAGAVMTDAVQMTVVLAAQFAAWKTWNAIAQGQSARRWRIVFWVLIGVGALSKGLATWALIGMPLIAYGVVQRRPVQILWQLFDGVGVLLCILIFLPWYVAAEYYYPGFINYFIVGEHFSRFLVPGWTGDRYGNAHREAIGMIWAYWMAAVLPWIGVFVAEGLRYLRKPREQVAPVESFLWCATLVPLVFFTFSRNIIWTYGLTAVIPFSVLVARWIESKSELFQRRISIAFAGLACVLACIAPVIYSNVNGNSDRDLVAAFEKTADHNAVLLYAIKPSFSTSFYAHERLHYDPQAALAVEGGMRYIVVGNDSVAHELALAPKNEVLFAGTRHTLLRIV
ncbi:ArnT family glycosyltransferase [Herminiimonas arsenitoxidans]|uniref:ArnT family glycosyltransferase n=1 Tax=Herminiimonas arsenitoxidans TaxID=1809410 RepID=UPI0009F8E130|nr:glycosyltransferase family 39 protein [Herminiimonas arsenitoxidans]